MEEKKEEILACAERTLHYTNLLIAQCDSWLTAEEGNKIENWKLKIERLRRGVPVLPPLRQTVSCYRQCICSFFNKIFRFFHKIHCGFKNKLYFCSLKITNDRITIACMLRVVQSFFQLLWYNIGFFLCYHVKCLLLIFRSDILN